MIIHAQNNYSARTIHHQVLLSIQDDYDERHVDVNQYSSPLKLNTFTARADHYYHIASFTDQYCCKIMTIIRHDHHQGNYIFQWKIA